MDQTPVLWALRRFVPLYTVPTILLNLHQVNGSGGAAAATISLV